MSRAVSLLMVVPQGLTVTGVTTWALTLTAALADRGIRTGLVVHGCAPGFAEREVGIGAGVRVYRPEGLPPIERAQGDVEPFARAYAEAASDLAGADGTVCLAPMRHGDCFAACARVTQLLGDRVRVIGWQQNDSAYEDVIFARYEPVFAGLVGVSTHITDRLAARFPHRASDIRRIWNAVRVPAECLRRQPLTDRPLELLYTGRVEHEQKRVLALIAMSDVLAQRGCRHRLTIMGDGPALREIRRAAESRSDRIRVPGAGSPDVVAAALRESDLFVLASRMEGLSFSMVEAMAQGCGIVATRTESGAGEAVVHGESGVMVDVGADATDVEVGRLMALGVEDALWIGVRELGVGAWQRALAQFDLRTQVDATIKVMRACADKAARVWPADRSCAFSPKPGSMADSGSVPADGAGRLGAALDALAGRRVVIHGVGIHTHHLMDTIRDRIERIAGFTDDNPAAWGFRIEDRPVVSPREAGALGATDVVISSFIHEGVVWDRRSVYERQGLRVHRIYAADTTHTPMTRKILPVVVSVHGPDVTSGVTTWSARMADRAGAACDWRMLVCGERVAVDAARERWPGSDRGRALFVGWDGGATPVARVAAVRQALMDIGADAVIGNYVPEAYAAGILGNVPTIGVAHAQHEWYREVMGRAAGGLGAWWAVSAGSRDRVMSAMREVPCAAVIPCGVEIAPARPTSQSTDGAIRLVYAGRLENVEKRVMDLVAVCDGLVQRGVRFVLRIVGDGPAESSVRDAAREHIRSGRIEMIGAVSSAEIGVHLAWADAIVLTSAREGMPVVAMEAMAGGRACAITEGCGDAVQIVRSYGCGAVVPVGDTEAMAEVIEMWSRDRAAVIAMGARGVGAAKTHFDISATGRATDAMVQNAIEHARAHPIGARERWAAATALIELIGDATEAELREAARGMANHDDAADPLPAALPGRWRMEERLAREALDRARAAGCTRIALFPAGRHTKRLGRALADAGEVVMIIDEQPSDTDVHGRTVMKPAAAIAAGIDAVIVSSDQHEAMVAAKARAWGVSVFTMYGEPETISQPRRSTAA